MKKTGLLCAVALVWVAGVAVARPRTSELPDAVVAAVELRELASLGPDLQELAVQIHPNLLIPSPSTAVAAQLLQTMNPRSVDMARPIRILLLAPPAHNTPLLVFSVTDTALYQDSLMLSRAEEQDRDGLLAYRKSDFPSAAPPEGGQPGPMVFLAIVGQQVIVGQDAGAVKTTRDLVREDRLPTEPLFDGDAGAVLRLQDLLSGLEEAGADPFEEMRREALAMVPGGSPERRNLQASIDMLEDLAGQLDTLSGQLSLGSGAVTATTWLEPVADTALDRCARSITPGEIRSLRYLPDDAIFALGVRTGDMGPLMDWWSGWVREVIPPGQVDEAAVQQMVDSLRQWTDVLGDEMAFAVSATQQGPLLLSEAVELADPARARELMEQVSEYLPTLATLQTTPGMDMATELEPEFTTHAGATISEWRFRWEVREEGLNTAQQRALAAQKAALEAAYGEELRTYGTIAGSDLLVTAGAGALDALKDTLDGATSSIAGSQKLSSALADAPPEPVAVGMFSLGEAANWYVRLIRVTLREMGTAFMIPPFQFRAGEPMGMTAYVRDQNVLEQRVRVPVDAMAALAEPFLGPAGPRQSGDESAP